MRRFRVCTGFLALITLLSLTACGKSEFGVTENTEKHMTVSAENAGKDAYIVVGSLEADAGEQIAIASSLSKGSIRIEIIGEAANESIDQLPDLNAEPIITANVKLTDSASGTVPAGSYMMKATVLEKASGTVTIDVKPADQP